MSAWDAKTKEWVRQGKLIVLGITQEQHAERCRLLAQWRQLGWPILHDPINLMQVTGVPIEVAIDEYGVVRGLRPNLETLEREFLDRTFAPNGVSPSEKPGEATGPQARNIAPGKGPPTRNYALGTPKPTPPDLATLRRLAEQEGSCPAWRDLGDALVLWAGPGGVDEAIHAYTQALQARPDDGDAHFRLGVCYRMRCESESPRPGDFQTAVDHWMTARSLQPNQYIWRRRIEQYGPRLTKPYPFYDWVPTANREIRARGDQPVEWKASLTGSELAGPMPGWEAEPSDGEPLEAEGRIARDTQDGTPNAIYRVWEPLVLAEVTVVPPKVKPGEAVRVYVTLRPNDARKACWSDEGTPLRVRIDLPSGWRAQPQQLIAAPVDRPDRRQPLCVECDIGTPADGNGTSRLLAHALYQVRDGEDETCRLLRQDVPITITVGK